jgi:hypothetical protein
MELSQNSSAETEKLTVYPKHGRDSNWMELKRIIMVFTAAHHWT